MFCLVQCTVRCTALCTAQCTAVKCTALFCITRQLNTDTEVRLAQKNRQSNTFSCTKVYLCSHQIWLQLIFRQQIFQTSILVTVCWVVQGFPFCLAQFFSLTVWYSQYHLIIQNALSREVYPGYSTLCSLILVSDPKLDYSDLSPY